MQKKYKTIKKYKIKRNKIGDSTKQKIVEDFSYEKKLINDNVNDIEYNQVNFTENDATVLDGMVSEFFDAFIVLGIDTKGEGHIVKKVKSFTTKAGLSILIDNLINMESSQNEDY